MQRTLLAAAALALAWSAAAQPQGAEPRRASISNGRAAFMRFGCYTCHGTVGHGGAGTRLAPNPLPLAAFQTWVRTGTPGWGFASGMPAFSRAVINDDELADIRAYLASIPSPAAADDIPLLRR